MKRYLPWCLVLLISLGWILDRNASGVFANSEKTWEAFEIEDLIAKRKESKRWYLPFLKRPTLRMGLYSLPKGANDRQPAHDEDEVYYIENGKAVLRIGDDEQPVKKGSVIFVKRDIPHRFHSIEEPLDVLVFFSSAKPNN